MSESETAVRGGDGMRSGDASPLEALWRLERRLAQQLRSGYCIGRVDEGGEPLTGLNSVGEGVVRDSRERPWLQAAGSTERERGIPAADDLLGRQKPGCL